MYRIIVRTCDAVSSLHGAARPFGLSKRETIETCFRSLLNAVERFPHSVHIVADRISDGLRDFFRSYPVTMTEGSFGNDESLRTSLRLALGYDRSDWIYFCEDDYLHAPHAFEWTNDLIEHRESILLTRSRRGLRRFIPNDHRRRLHTMPLVIHLPDYPDRYKPRERTPSYLFVSQYCHWRQVTNTTFSFLLQGSTVHTYRSALERASHGADDGLLSRAIYAGDRFQGRALCLSPVPGVATHMHEHTMTPLVDWKRIKDARAGTL